MKLSRNIISWSLVILGIILLLFSILWRLFAVERIVRFPSGLDLFMKCEGTLQRLADTHGLLALPPGGQDLELNRRLISEDEQYTSGKAVVAEEINGPDGGLPGDLDLDEENVYVFERRDGMNVKSDLSTSSGTVVDRSGSWYVNFPLGTKKESYNLFNNDAASSFAVNFDRETEINGISVFVFEGSFPLRPMVDYRAEAWGLPTTTTFGALKEELEASGVPLDRMIQLAYGSLTSEERETISDFPDDLEVELEYTLRHGWEGAVEPVTGTIVDVSRYETSIFVNTDVRTFLPLLEILAAHSEDPLVSEYMSQVEQQKVLEPREIYRISYKYAPESVQDMTEFANSRIGPIRFVKDYVTVMMMILGAISLIGGLLLRRERHPHAAPVAENGRSSEEGTERGE